MMYVYMNSTDIREEDAVTYLKILLGKRIYPDEGKIHIRTVFDRIYVLISPSAIKPAWATKLGSFHVDEEC